MPAASQHPEHRNRQNLATSTNEKSLDVSNPLEDFNHSANTADSSTATNKSTKKQHIIPRAAYDLAAVMRCKQDENDDSSSDCLPPEGNTSNSRSVWFPFKFPTG